MKIKIQLCDIICDNTAMLKTGLNPYCVNEGADGEEYKEVEIDDKLKYDILNAIKWRKI